MLNLDEETVAKFLEDHIDSSEDDLLDELAISLLEKNRDKARAIINAARGSDEPDVTDAEMDEMLAAVKARNA